MSELRSFVTEKELEEAKKARQAEWERVRQPDQPLEAPEPEHDNRCLYERLKEQRERKQAEIEETQKLRHMIRGLDSEEVGFLDIVDDMKAAEEKKRRQEELELIQQIQKIRETENLGAADVPAAATSSAASAPKVEKQLTPKSKALSKQAQIISAGIKRKSSGSDKNDAPTAPMDEKRSKIATIDNDAKVKETQNSAAVTKQNSASASTSVSMATENGCCLTTVGLRPSAIRQLGTLPSLSGKIGYHGNWICGSPPTDSSDSSDSSNDDNDGLVSSNRVKIKIGGAAGGGGGKQQQISIDIKDCGGGLGKRNAL